MLHAIIFAIHDCGFHARIALEDTGSNESRLDKVVRLIGQSRLSIHDMSRVERTRGLPRFNMPFECGLACGAMRYAPSKQRDALVVVGKPFQDKKTLSDLAGIDPGYHHNQPELLVAAVRKFLAAKSRSTQSTLGAVAIY
jgi:hypothetical protein